jgi:hypothetical protein
LQWTPQWWSQLLRSGFAAHWSSVLASCVVAELRIRSATGSTADGVSRIRDMSDPRDDTASKLSELLDSLIPALSQETIASVLDQVLAFHNTEILRERERCAQLCLSRAELWRTTFAARSDAPKQAREEACARRNEATLLADVIRTDPSASTATANGVPN